MNWKLKFSLGTFALVLATQAVAQITFYEGEDLRGRAFTTNKAAASGPPDHWDVTYDFRGIEHRLQMSAPPGPTIAVNGNGEPRQ